MKQFVEFRLRPVTRFIVTRCDWESDGEVESSGEVRQLGPEYANEDIAYEVAYALARAEHERLGYVFADDRLRYPTRPSENPVPSPKTGGVSPSHR